MNWDQVEGKWKQYAGNVREKWGKLTDSDIETIRGQRDQLIGKIQERYGIAKEAAQQEVDAFVSALKDEDAEDRRSSRRSRSKAHSAGRA
jgi:uncharacterized protein YjbJ (UPF0337 family)